MKPVFRSAVLFSLFVLVPMAAGQAAAAAKTVKEAAPIVAIYDLEGLLSESGEARASMLDPGSLFDSARPLTLLDLTRSLEKAAADPAVKAVVVDADGCGMDLAQIQELRRRLLAVREAGKDVWLYSEGLGNQAALLGSAASRFMLMPEADCSFHGLHAESLYFKGLLDKAGVTAQVIHIGDFKSFGETFSREGPSDQARQQEDALVGSVFERLVADVAAGRGLAPEKVLEFIDNGAQTPATALAAGLADGLSHRTDFVRAIREAYGKEADYRHDYELPDREGPQIDGMMDLIRLLFSGKSAARSRADYVAVVALDGDISDESVAPVREEILRLIRDQRAKALVLRVNSPGGSALASEVLWEATDEWKQNGRPFAVSMGGTAASGGYYISAAADRIFAEAGTLTGSIGVVGMKFVLGDALARIGVNTHAARRGRHSGMASPFHPYSEEEQALVKRSMEQVYGTFKNRITEGRGERLTGDLEALAGGRVFTGLQALGHGLVDELGGLTEAIGWVATKAGLDKPVVRLCPEPESPFQGLFSTPEREDDDELIRAAAAHGATPAAQARRVVLDALVSPALPPSTRLAINRLADRLERFASARVLMLAPEWTLR
jgi:protease IV